jgi:TPR repeat protein
MKAMHADAFLGAIVTRLPGGFEVAYSLRTADPEDIPAEDQEIRLQVPDIPLLVGALRGRLMTPLALVFGASNVVGSRLGEEIVPPDMDPLELQRKCEAGNIAGCVDVCRLYVLAPKTAHVEERLAHFSQEACLLGDAPGCGRAGQLAAKQRRPGAAVAAWYDKGCTRNDADCCMAEAQVFLLGENIAADVARGLPLMERSCELGNTSACAIAGQYFLDGKKVPADRVRAVKLLDKSCGEADHSWDTNEGAACYFLARTLGEDNDPDKRTRALNLHRKMCGNGGIQSCEEWAALISSGKGTDDERREAMSKLKRICRLTRRRESCAAARMLATKAH